MGYILILGPIAFILFLILLGKHRDWVIPLLCIGFFIWIANSDDFEEVDDIPVIENTEAEIHNVVPQIPTPKYNSTDLDITPASDNYQSNTFYGKTPTYKPTKNFQQERIRIGAVCMDGTISNATGGGACSYHGGVDYWLYE